MVVTSADPKQVGQWETPFSLQNVAVHAHLLPTGKVLYWGRRADLNNPEMNQHLTNSFILDPITKTSKATATRPKSTTGDDVNLFCSGHCFQPDGTLFVAGGHLQDGWGSDQACVYDSFANKWTAKPTMNSGRWYPSALTLSDGSILVMSGQGDGHNNHVPQIWRNNAWTTVTTDNFGDQPFPLFPQMHLDPTGRIFVAGPTKQSQFLTVGGVNAAGSWTTDGPSRNGAYCDYGPSVMYDTGKVVNIGGGIPPTRVTELIDLNPVLKNGKPSWAASANTPQMNFARRQCNATVLPDGTVLVSGGTSGAGGDTNPPGFNDLANSVHQAELWDPNTNKWSLMAEENTDRCYHSIALLLQDGRVLSAGGGEGANAPPYTDAQIYDPPYLFKGARPTISNPPKSIDYNKPFEIIVGTSDSIKTVSWIRLGSVTHSTNMNQSLTFLSFKQQATKVTITGPANSNIAPPGHYMLFVLNQQGVPALAPIISIGSVSTSVSNRAVSTSASTMQSSSSRQVAPRLPELNEKIVSEQTGPPIIVGLKSTCPYGLGACWGGAYDALKRIDDIAVVRPIPDEAHSLAFVYTHQDIVPDIEKWQSEFEQTANRAYHLHGIEMTLVGAVRKTHAGADEYLTMAGTPSRPEVKLVPFQGSSNVKWDRHAQALHPISDSEAGAYARLSTLLTDHSAGLKVTVTGRLEKHHQNRYSLHVREFDVVDDKTQPSN